MEWKKMVAYGMVAMMLLGVLLSIPVSSAEDGPLYEPDSMPAVPQNETSAVPPPLPSQITGGWTKIVTDPDEGGINVKDGYVQVDDDNLYLRMTSYSPWTSTYGQFYALIWIDADQDPATGSSINDIGADYWIIAYGYGYHYIYAWNGGGWSYGGTISYMDTPTSDTVDLGLNWASIGGVSDKDIVYGFIDVSTWQWDYAPDGSHGTLTLPKDLSVESDGITFSGDAVASSDIYITAKVQNNMWLTQRDVQARFYLDGNTHIYHTVTISSIPGRGSATVTVPWHVPSYEGSHTVKVVVDPNNLINETDEGNNMAETPVTVQYAPQSTATSSSGGASEALSDTMTMGLFGITMLLLVLFVVLIAIRRSKRL